MNFHNINEYNVFMNWLSANFLPVTEDKKRLGLGKTIRLIAEWTVMLTFFATMLIGVTYYAHPKEALKKTGPSIIIYTEVMIISFYLNCRRGRLRTFVLNINSSIVQSDSMRRCIRDNVDLNVTRLKIYAIAGVGSVFVFAAMPIVTVFDNDEFTYDDLTLPSYTPGDPFSPALFALYVCVQTVSMTLAIMKKVSIDIYTNFCITLLTAEYQCLQKQITAAFNENDEKLVIDALKECIEQHCKVMKTGSILVDILAVNIGLNYILCIAGLCCLAFTFVMMGGSTDTTTLKVLDIAFGFGSLLQVFVQCWCIQELLESSTTLVDGACYANWWDYGPIAKSILVTLGLGNQIECRLTAFRIVDLTVPTFATILNQAYSACLLLLRI